MRVPFIRRRGSRNIRYTPAEPTPLEVTTSSLPAGQDGVAYDQTLSAIGGEEAYSWAVTVGALPDGLSLNSGTGQITGTPTTAETANFTVEVTSGEETDTQELSITIRAEVVVTTTTLPDAQQGVEYEENLAATGGTGSYSWSVSSGSLPTGLSLSLAGVISGIPTGTGTANFTVQASSGGGSDTQALSIDVDEAVLITTVSLPNGEVDVAYDELVEATGGSGSYVFAVVSGALPDGLSLNTGSGAITGTPTSDGTFNFTISATSQGSVDAQAYSVDIDESSSEIPLSGLIAWHDPQTVDQADNSELETLLDLSGNGNTLDGTDAAVVPRFRDGVTVGSGSLNGHKSVLIPANTTSYLVYGGHPMDGETEGEIFIVLMNGEDPAGSEGRSGLWAEGIPNFETHHPYTNGQIYESWGTTERLAAGNPTPPLTSMHVYNVISADDEYTVNINGSQLATRGTNTPSFLDSGGSPRVGRAITESYNYFGYIGEIISYNRVLSGAERTQVHDYLAAKWALEAPEIQESTIADATNGEAYSEALTVLKGDGNSYTWSVISGSLPSGLSLGSSTGVISGTPDTDEEQTFTVQVSSGGETDTVELTIEVTSPAGTPDPDWSFEWDDYADMTAVQASGRVILPTPTSGGSREILTGQTVPWDNAPLGHVYRAVYAAAGGGESTTAIDTYIDTSGPGSTPGPGFQWRHVWVEIWILVEDDFDIQSGYKTIFLNEANNPAGANRTEFKYEAPTLKFQINNDGSFYSPAASFPAPVPNLEGMHDGTWRRLRFERKMTTDPGTVNDAIFRCEIDGILVINRTGQNVPTDDPDSVFWNFRIGANGSPANTSGIRFGPPRLWAAPNDPGWTWPT